MDLDLINDFLAVARLGKLSAAATQLRTNHSTVYRRLNQLEEQLDCRLFERMQSGYELTAAGQELLVYAERIEQEAMAAERALAGKDLTLQGEVRVTAPENLAYVLLPAYLQAFHRLHPQIRVTVIVSNSELDLNRREADIAIRATPRPPDYLVGKKIVSAPWFVYGSRAYLKRAGRPKALKDLAAHAWVGPDAVLFHIAAFIWFQKHIPDEQVTVRATTLNAMATLAEAGMGLVLLPVDQTDKKLERIMLFEPGAGSDLWLLTHPDLRYTARIKVLMDFLIQALQADVRLQGI
jgi:DNA-binding transcriptional LysR family regulator